MGNVLCLKFTQKMMDLSKVAKLIQKERLFKANTKPTGLFYFFKQFPLQYLKQLVYLFLNYFSFFLLLKICLLFNRMAANSHEDRTHWVSAIQDSIQVDPAYDIVRQKKAALRRKSIRFVYIFYLTSFFSKPIFWKIINNFD